MKPNGIDYALKCLDPNKDVNSHFSPDHTKLKMPVEIENTFEHCKHLSPNINSNKLSDEEFKKAKKKYLKNIKVSLDFEAELCKTTDTIFLSRIYHTRHHKKITKNLAYCTK